MKYVHTDPRTKLFVLLICAIAITISPSLYYEGGLVFIILLYGILSGRPKYSFLMAIAYSALIGLAIISNFYFTDAAYTASVGSDVGAGLNFMRWNIYPVTTIGRLILED